MLFSASYIKEKWILSRKAETMTPTILLAPLRVLHHKTSFLYRNIDEVHNTPSELATLSFPPSHSVRLN